MMPVYVTLGKYTAEAIKNLHEVAERLQQNTQLIEAKGGKLLAFYGLMGEWDILAITEFPDEKSAMSALLTIGKAGRLMTQTLTLTAVSGEEFAILAKNA
jgi:uncharacterized protein with GYD domain